MHVHVGAQEFATVAAYIVLLFGLVKVLVATFPENPVVQALQSILE